MFTLIDLDSLAPVPAMPIPIAEIGDEGDLPNYRKFRFKMLTNAVTHANIRDVVKTPNAGVAQW